MVRFAVTAFAASRCYTGSAGRLSCVTCHDPHQRLSTNTAVYERVCRSCHSGTDEGRTTNDQRIGPSDTGRSSFAVARSSSPNPQSAIRHPQSKPCPVNPRAGCVGCHMPAQPAGFPTPTTFRNHWIKVYPSSSRQGRRGAAARQQR
jgi:hypothetical protein